MSTAAMRRFSVDGSNGIMQVSIAGVASGPGTSIKAMVAGSLVVTSFAKEIAKKHEVNNAPHTRAAEGQTR